MNISRVFHSTISNQALLISLPKRKGRKGKERLVSIFTLASSSRNWRGKVRTHFLFQEKVVRPRLLTHRVMLCRLYWICIFHSHHVYFMARPSTPPWHPRTPNLLHWLSRGSCLGFFLSFFSPICHPHPFLFSPAASPHYVALRGFLTRCHLTDSSSSIFDALSIWKTGFLFYFFSHTVMGIEGFWMTVNLAIFFLTCSWNSFIPM